MVIIHECQKSQAWHILKFYISTYLKRLKKLSKTQSDLRSKLVSISECLQKMLPRSRKFKQTSTDTLVGAPHIAEVKAVDALCTEVR